MGKHAEDWVNKALIRMTPKGAMVDIRMYVYPDTHGNLQHIDPERVTEKGVQQDNCPVNNVDEAVLVLRTLWEHLARSRKT